jgi:hypothetical protein
MLGCPCICIPVCLCQRFSCCCVCLRSYVLAHAHVYTLCPYACNRLQLLLCFCTPVWQIVRLYTCMIELLTTVCLYAWVAVWLDACMLMCTFFCVLFCVAIKRCVCLICPFCLFTCEFVRLSACAPVARCICQCLLSVVCVALVAGWNDSVD